MTARFVRYVHEHLETHIAQGDWEPTPQVIQAFGTANKYAIEHTRVQLEMTKRYHGELEALGDEELETALREAAVHHLETADEAELDRLERVRKAMADARDERAH